MPVFLSPARRERGILVAPGFCPASGFLVGAKTQNLPVNFFFNLNMTFLATWGCASDFLRCYQNSISPPEVNSKNFCERKNFENLTSEIIQILLSHSPPYGDVQVTFLRFH